MQEVKSSLKLSKTLACWVFKPAGTHTLLGVSLLKNTVELLNKYMPYNVAVRFSLSDCCGLDGLFICCCDLLFEPFSLILFLISIFWVSLLERWNAAEDPCVGHNQLHVASGPRTMEQVMEGVSFSICPEKQWRMLGCIWSVKHGASTEVGLVVFSLSSM